MSINNKIYFVISGVTDGFKKSHILTNNNIDEVLNYLDDRRQICNTALENFYSIEKTKNYVLVTIFNPNTEDHVGRKAYISITLFVNKEYIIIGDIMSTLDNLMLYYLNKQASQISIRFTQEMFEDNYQNLTIQKNYNPNYFIDKNNGYFEYENVLNISEYFQNLSIPGYEKVYFLNKSNVNVIDQLFNYDKILEFKNSNTFSITGFDESKFEIRLNNNAYRPTYSLNRALIRVYKGDQVVIRKIKNSSQKKFEITNFDQNVHINDIFPIENQIITPKLNTTKQVPSSNQQKNDYKINRILLVTLVIVVAAVVLFYLDEEGYFDKQPKKDIIISPVNTKPENNNPKNTTQSGAITNTTQSGAITNTTQSGSITNTTKSGAISSNSGSNRANNSRTELEERNCITCKNFKVQIDEISKNLKNNTSDDYLNGAKIELQGNLEIHRIKEHKKKRN